MTFGKELIQRTKNSTKRTTVSFIGESDQIWRDLLRPDDGAAANEHLAAGFPIYYSEDDTPADLLIKEYPNGKRELIRVNGKVDEVIKII